MTTSSLLDESSTATLPPIGEISPEKIGESGQPYTSPDGIGPTGIAGVAGQIAGCEPGEPLLVVGRQGEIGGSDGELRNFGVTYALGRLSGKSSKIEGEGGEVILPTSGFALLSRFSLSQTGDFSSLRLHKDSSLALSQVLAGQTTPADAINDGSTLQQALGLNTDDMRNLHADFQRRGLSATDLDEFGKPILELHIGEEGVAKFTEGLDMSSDPAERLYSHDFSLLRAIMDQAG